ncbi:MAG TPA: Lrp/AsnC ligand binding domain-containing protein [Nitrososphaerales archaeon]|nr:Lrp/AsnC ligand binding domain-containing protein [Nitrososphaerales archaeon]
MRRAFVLVNSDVGSETELQSELKKLEGVIAVYQVYGLFDLVVEVEAESDKKLKEIVFSKIRPLKSIKSTVTLAAV